MADEGDFGMDIDDEGEQEGDRNHDDPNNEGFIGDE